MYELLFQERVWHGGEKLVFTRFFQTDGHQLHPLYLKRYESKRKRTDSGFPMTNYYYLFHGRTDRLSWDQLTAPRSVVSPGDKSKNGKGGKMEIMHSSSFKGLFNMQFASDNFFKGGKEEVKSFLSRHIVFAIDPGLKEDTCVGIKTSFLESGEMEMECLPFSFTTKSKYATFKMKQQFSPDALQDMVNIAQTTKKTNDLAEIQKYWATLDSAVHLKAENADPTHLQQRLDNDMARQRCNSKMINTSLAVLDRLSDPNDARTPLFLVGGNYKGGGGYGLPCSAPAQMIKELAKVFPVGIVNEYHTSQSCPKCMGPSELTNAKGTRIWKCKTGCMVDCCLRDKKGRVLKDEDGREIMAEKPFVPACSFTSCFVSRLLLE
jgi:hypothetical protein